MKHDIVELMNSANDLLKHGKEDSNLIRQQSCVVDFSYVEFSKNKQLTHEQLNNHYF